MPIRQGGVLTNRAIRSLRRQLSVLQAAYRVSTRRACEVIGLYRATYYYQSHRPSDTALRHRLKELAAVRIRYGYQRFYILLRREGWQVNHKKVYRLYCEEGLNLRSKRPPQRRVAAHRLARPENRVTLDFSRPGKPTDNPFIESFNGSFRDECLNTNWFLSLDDAKEM